MTTDIETLQGLTSFLLGVNESYYSCVKSSQGAAWSRTSIINEQHRTYAQSKIFGKMNVHSKETLIQLVEGQSQDILKLIEVEGGPVVKQFLKEMHKCDRKVIQGPGQALMALIAVAMTILTQGAAAPLASNLGLGTSLAAKAVMGALLSSVATQMTVASLQNKGNPLKAAKTLATKEFLKSLAVKMATAGLTAGVMAHFDMKIPDASMADTLSNPELFLQQMTYNTVQETVGIGVRATLGGEKLDDLLKDGLINIGAGTIAQFIATKIGAARFAQLKAGNNSLSDYMLHKMYHGILGAGRGAALAALRGEDVGSAALGGSIGGIVAEVVAEEMRERMLRQTSERFKSGSEGLSPEKKIELYNRIRSEELAKVRGFGEGASIIFATLFKANIDQAQGAARNAVDNNASHAFAWGIPPDVMRSIQTAMAAGAAGIVAAGEALAAGVAAAGGAVVATYAGVAVVLIGGVYYYVTLDAEPEASKPKVESFPEEQARAQSFTTPAHESRPTRHATPGHDQASSSSDKGFDTYEGPDARVFTSDGAKFSIKKEDVVKTYTHPRFGKFYEMKDGTVYSKDRAGHGGSAWKMFKETSKGFEWKADLDANGREMNDKHKGSTGKFIPKKEFSTNGGGK